jgi:hypothetical protein
MAFCSLYGPLKTEKLPLLLCEMFSKTHFIKTPRIVAIYFVLAMIAIIAIITIITQAKYLRNSDDRFSKKSCDNRDNHIQKEAIIIFREKLKTPFRINPSTKTLYKKTVQTGVGRLWDLSVWFGGSLYNSFRTQSSVDV